MSFGPKYKSKRIEIDTDGISSNSPNVSKRLDRIERNYSALETILDELESRIEMDDRLAGVADEVENELPRKPR